jgi:hypothetical protein
MPFDLYWKWTWLWKFLRTVKIPPLPGHITAHFHSNTTARLDTGSTTNLTVCTVFWFHPRASVSGDINARVAWLRADEVTRYDVKSRHFHGPSSTRALLRDFQFLKKGFEDAWKYCLHIFKKKTFLSGVHRIHQRVSETAVLGSEPEEAHMWNATGCYVIYVSSIAE